MDNHSSAVDEYIAEQPEAVQPELRALRATIHAAAPNALEKISWSMPTFWQGENLIHFAAFKHHIGLYPGPEAIEAFADRLALYRTSRGPSSCRSTPPRPRPHRRYRAVAPRPPALTATPT